MELAPQGHLRVSLNMANAVLAMSNTMSEKPAGVTIDLSRELGRRLGVEVELIEWAAPGDSVRALATGRADVGYLAVDPGRAQQVWFTQPYVQIEGCYLAKATSPLRNHGGVDQPGTDVLVIDTSAYDLHLTRTLKHATVVRLRDAQDVLQALLAHDGRAVVAGVKQALINDMKSTGGLRLLDGYFMAIFQAMVLPRGRSEIARQAVEAFLGEMVESGFIASSLASHGIDGATVVREASAAATGVAFRAI